MRRVLICLFLTIFVSSSWALDFPDRPNTVDKNIELSWQIPEFRANGDALDVTEIAGYEIYYAIDGGATNVIDIPGGTTTTYTMGPVVPGSYELSIATYDTGGLYSIPSNPITAVVEPSSAPEPPVLTWIERIVAWFKSFLGYS